MTASDARGRTAATLLLAATLCGGAASARAQALIAPSFLGACGSSGMTAGGQAMMFSAPQTGAAVSYSGPHALHAGFFGFMSGFTDSATTVAGQPTVLVLSTPAGIATITLPADSVPAGTLITVLIPAAAPAAGGVLTAVPFTPIQIDSLFQPTVPVTVDIAYTAVDTAGLTPVRFTVASFDPALNAWVALASTVDASNKVVIAQTNHFSIYELMQPAAASAASTAKAFPNPLRPALGESAMAFARLPANARIRIYTVKGAVIKELSADAAGGSSWDGTNQSGADAASGVYFALVKGPGEPFTLTVAIER